MVKLANKLDNFMARLDEHQSRYFKCSGPVRGSL